MDETTFSVGDLLEFLRRIDPRFDRPRLDGWYRRAIFDVVTKSDTGQRRFALVDLVGARVALQLMDLTGAYVTREAIRTLRGGEVEDKVLLLGTRDVFKSLGLAWLPKKSAKEIAAMIVDASEAGNTVVMVPIAAYFAAARAFIEELEKRRVQPVGAGKAS